MAYPRSIDWAAGIAVLIGMGSVLARGQGPPPIPSGSGFILGQVTEVGGAPVESAVVTLTGLLPGAAAGRTVRSAPRSVITNAQGEFLFPSLPAGRYSIAVAAFGYLEKRPSEDGQLSIDLGANERRGGLQILMWRTASIGGTVTDEFGDPAPGVLVTALRRGARGGRLELTRQVAARTDDRGVYRLAGLPPGHYVVGVLVASSTIPASLAVAVDAASADPAAAFALNGTLIPGLGGARLENGAGFRVGDVVLLRPDDRAADLPPADDQGRMLAYSTAFYPGTPQVGQAALIALGSGDSRVNIDLPIKLTPTVRVSGVMSGPDGPMANLALRLVPVGSKLSSGEPLAVTNSFESLADPIGGSLAVSNATGAFVFLDVPAGAYTLQAVRVPQPGPPGAPSSEAPLWFAQIVTVGSADVTDLALAMRPGIRVAGRVEFIGTAPKPSPQELARISALLVPVGVEAFRTRPSPLGTDGTFATAGDPPGEYFPVASNVPPGWTVQAVTLAGYNVTDEPISVEAADLTDLVIRFTDTPSGLAGSILDGKGVPDAHADVIVFPADTTSWRQGMFGTQRTQLRPATGAATYAFSPLPPGDYFLVAVDHSLTTEWEDPAFLDRCVSGATRVSLRAGEQKTVGLKTLEPGGMLW